MIRETIIRIPVIGPLAKRIFRIFVKKNSFTTSGDYWEKRYSTGGNSGAGSYDNLAEFKAEVINQFVEVNNIGRVIEFGCGDGNQLKYFNFGEYLGFDVSQTAIANCRRLYADDPGKRFEKLSDYAGERAELVLSLDVLYHLVEDEVFDSHMQSLFSSSEKYVIIYSSNVDDDLNVRRSPHVRLRKFTGWIEKNFPMFELLDHIPNRYPRSSDPINSSISDFYIYRHTGA